MQQEHVKNMLSYCVYSFVGVFQCKQAYFCTFWSKVLFLNFLDYFLPSLVIFSEPLNFFNMTAVTHFQRAQNNRACSVRKVVLFSLSFAPAGLLSNPGCPQSLSHPLLSQQLNQTRWVRGLFPFRRKVIFFLSIKTFESNYKIFHLYASSSHGDFFEALHDCA